MNGRDPQALNGHVVVVVVVVTRSGLCVKYVERIFPRVLDHPVLIPKVARVYDCS